jgi:mannose-6-phosphate isomerase
MSVSRPVAPAIDGGVRRPWGSYVVVDEAAGHKTKRLTIDPGARLSYQRHHCRAEHWFIVAGLADAILDGRARRLTAGDSVDIPPGCAHRIANPGTTELVLVEVQTGSYFGEDDIERLADDYGRMLS